MGPLSGNTHVSRYQKGRTNLDFTEARDSEWQWHQLGHMQVCTSLKTDNYASTPPLSFYRPFNGLFFLTIWVSWYRKRKTSLDINDARDDGVLGCSGISWTICKQSAPRSRQTTTHHSDFTGRMHFLAPNQQCHSQIIQPSLIQFDATQHHSN